MARQRPDSTPEQKPRRLAQLRQVFRMTRQADPLIGWWMAGAFLGILLIGFLIGSAVGHPVYATFVALPLALLAATFLLSRRAERAMYRMFENQPGGAGAALQGLRRGWSYEQEPVAVDAGRSTQMTEAGLVYRAVGRQGVVLIGEGPAGRTSRLLQSERKKVQRLAPNVPVTVLRVGSGSGPEVVSHRHLLGRMNKLPKTLTKQEVSAVAKRLRSMGGARPPVPPGIDPMRARHLGKGLRR